MARWRSSISSRTSSRRPRLGITASRKVGKAVVRHRLKRRIKEIYRRWQDRGQLPASDLVVHLKPEAGKSDFPALRSELLRLLSGLRERREAAGVTRLLVFLLGVYKRRVSPLLPRACRFTPTCSEYARLALLKHGLWRGGRSRPAASCAANPSIPAGSTCPRAADCPRRLTARRPRGLEAPWTIAGCSSPSSFP